MSFSAEMLNHHFGILTPFFHQTFSFPCPDESYCLYGDCTKRAVYVFTPTPSSAGGRNGTMAQQQPQQQLVRERSHFCCHDHYYRVVTKGREILLVCKNPFVAFGVVLFREV